MDVLLVDDDDQLRGAIARRLRSRGLAVDAARGIGEATLLLDRRAYRVVVSDESLKDGFGHALLVSVARCLPRCRRALVSATAAPVDATIVWHRFFEKPTGLDALVAWAVEQCGEEP